MKPNLTHHILDFWSSALPPPATTSATASFSKSLPPPSSSGRATSTSPRDRVQRTLTTQQRGHTASASSSSSNQSSFNDAPTNMSIARVDEHAFYKPMAAPHRHKLHADDDASWESPNVTLQYFSPDEPASYVQTYATRRPPGGSNTSTPPHHLKSAMKATARRASPLSLTQASSSSLHNTTRHHSQGVSFRTTPSLSTTPHASSFGASTPNSTTATTSRLASGNKEDAHNLLHAQADLFVTRSSTAHKPLAKRQYHTYHPNRTVSKMLVQYAPAVLAGTNEGAEILLQSSRVLAAERINNHLAKHIVAVRGGRKTPFQTRATQRAATSAASSSSSRSSLSKPSSSSSSSQSWHGAGGDHRFRPLVLVEGVKGGVYFINASGKRQYVKQSNASGSKR